MSRTIKTSAIKLGLSGASAIALAAALLSPTFASAATAADAAAPSDASTIEEVVVTAQRKEENIQKVPVAVTAISAAQIERGNITSADDIQFHVPELQVNPSQYLLNAEPSFTLRGLSTTVPGTTIADASVATYFGDAPLLYNRDIGHGMFDLQNIQVLRGPQGTLFGKNSTGGAVIISPAKPTHEMAGLIQLTGGDYNLRELTAMVNVPISDMLQVRVAGKIGRRDGYTKNLMGPDLDDEHFESGRISVAFQPTESFDNYTMVDVESSRENIVAKIATKVGGPALFFYSACCGGGFFMNPALGSQADLLAQFARQQQLGHRTVASPWPNYVNIDAYTINNVSTLKLGDDLTVKNIASYQHSKSIFVLASGEMQYNFAAPLVNPDEAKQFSDEIQLLGKSFDQKLDWVVGGFYSKQDDDNVNDATIFADYNPAIAGLVPYVQFHHITAASTDKATALYAHASFDLGDMVEGLKFSAGYRYTWDKRGLELGSVGTNANLGGFFTATPPFMITSCAVAGATLPKCLTSFKSSLEAPSWTVGLDYQITPRVLTYIVARHGFKSGGFNATTGIPGTNEYSPEKMTDVEIGLKADWTLGDMPLRTNVAIFDGKLKNPTVPLLPVYNGNVYQVLQNVKGAEIKGVEFEFNLKASSHLQLSGSYSLTKGTYDDGSSIITVYGPGGTAAATQNLSGTPLTGSSEHTAQLSAFYDFEIDPKYGDLSASLDYAVRTKQRIPGQGGGDALLPGFDIVNMRVALNNIGGRGVDFSVWGKNITDKQYITSQQLFANVLGLDNVTYGSPRQIGATLSYHW